MIQIKDMFQIVATWLQFSTEESTISRQKITMFQTVLNFENLSSSENKLFCAGADASSWFLYMGTKGKVEEAVKSLGLDRVSVYRPGLLITPREETRLLEKCAQTLVPFLDRGSSKSISGLTMAIMTFLC